MTTKERLLDRFAVGALTEDELEQFNSLITQDSSFRDLVRAWIALREYSQRPELYLSEADVAIQYRKLEMRLGFAKPSSLYPGVGFWSALAVGVLLTTYLLITVFLNLHTVGRSETQQVRQTLYDSSRLRPLQVLSCISSWDSLQLTLFAPTPMTIVFDVHLPTGEIVRSFDETLSEGETHFSLYWRSLPSGHYHLGFPSVDTQIVINKPEGPLFVRTTDSISELDDIATTVASMFGPDYVPADFKLDLKKYCTKFNRELDLIKMVHWRIEESLMLVDSERSIDTVRGQKDGRKRHFLVTRSEHGMIHYGYEILDTLPNGELLEGSWYGRFPVIAVRKSWRKQ